MPEVLDQRVLAGVRFEDAATGAVVRNRLHLRAGSGARFFRNRRHVHVLERLDGLEEHVGRFEAPPAAPAPGSMSLPVEVRDPQAFYLPRRFELALPRSGDPDAADAVTRAVPVALFRSPRAGSSTHWAMVHGRLERGSTGEALPAAFLRVVLDADDTVLATGTSVFADPDAAALSSELGASGRWQVFSERVVGEIALPIVGIATTVWGTESVDPVVLDDVPATLEVIPIDPGAGLPDPEEFASSVALPQNRWPLSVAAGRRIHVGTLEVTVP